MKGLCLFVAWGVLAAGCGGGDEPEVQSDASVSCADVIRWDGREYVGTGVRTPVPLGGSIGEGARDGCGEARDAVPLVRVRDVNPEDAVGSPRDPVHLYVARELAEPEAVLPSPVARILLGPSCESEGAFVVAGTFVGSSNLDVPHRVTLDVDEVDERGRRFLGLLVDLTIVESTSGLRERSDFYPFASSTAETRRLRARVRCTTAERPNESFVAELIELAPPEPPAADRAGIPDLCAPDKTQPPCGPGAGLGISYPFDLDTHCGVEYALFDGRLWLLDPPLNDGSGNPPPGWDNPFQHGLVRLLADDVAEFRTAKLNVRFEPAPVSYERPGCD